MHMCRSHKKRCRPHPARRLGSDRTGTRIFAQQSAHSRRVVVEEGALEYEDGPGEIDRWPERTNVCLAMEHLVTF